MHPSSASPKNQILFGWPLHSPPAAGVLAALTQHCAEPTTSEAALLFHSHKMPPSENSEQQVGVPRGATHATSGETGSGLGMPDEAAAARGGDASELAALAASEWLPDELVRTCKERLWKSRSIRRLGGVCTLLEAASYSAMWDCTRPMLKPMLFPTYFSSRRASWRCCNLYSGVRAGQRMGLEHLLFMPRAHESADLCTM